MSKFDKAIESALNHSLLTELFFAGMIRKPIIYFVGDDRTYLLPSPDHCVRVTHDIYEFQLFVNDPKDNDTKIKILNAQEVQELLDTETTYTTFEYRKNQDYFTDAEGVQHELDYTRFKRNIIDVCVENAKFKGE